MDNRITKLSRDPFYAATSNGVSLVVDPLTGDISMGSPVLRAWKGLVFSLIPEPTGHLLRLQYRDIKIGAVRTKFSLGKSLLAAMAGRDFDVGELARPSDP